MMMKMKRLPVAALAVLLVAPSFLVDAAPQTIAAQAASTTQTEGELASKEEVIYANLLADGSLDQMYIVNTLNVSKAGTIMDYGNYNSLKNLTDLTELEQMEDHVQVEAEKGPFYYQGNVDGTMQLPWDITVTYFLDGKEVSPDELAGADGSLEINIETQANDDVAPAFFENYLLQISMLLEEGVYSNIETEEGMIANAGKNKQVTFTVMPEQEEELSLSADVVDFESDGIEIAAVPSTMSIDSPDIEEITSEFNSLSDAIKEIDNGVGELKNGISELNSGVASLYDGSGQFRNGMSELAGSSGELINGSKAIDQALSEISRSLQVTDNMDLGDLNSLPQGLTQIAEGLHETSVGLSTLRENYTLAYGSLDEAMTAIPDHQISESDIQSLYESGADPAVVEKLVDTYAAAQKAKGTYTAVGAAFAAVDSTLNEVSSATKEMGDTLKSIANGLSSSLANMDSMDSLTQLQQGLAELSANYSEFHSGLVSYTNGVGELSSSYNEIHSGIGELSGGTTELENGTGELRSGTTKLYDATSNLPEQMQEEIDAMISEYDKSDFEAVSFVSDKNENVNTVQFVIKTEAIKKEEQEVTEDAEEKEENFWTRLMDLFRRG
ncbi:YhgE/Pip domain-containing protein [Alkalihalophilus pseudofirmus]|uniref:YhgE/Pip domain-containing protein n=1 Tax=Alkalihalophilus pseudofirmus TaxID=79885 RepID=UPI00259B0A30|nr:YhgE/Pip domain-containing protein [Alkalihalophilus pseudofirmus]WEG18819.1 YhgE/Pip domain-containing protein [Alkalihalophilus pseudofirmus]